MDGKVISFSDNIDDYPSGNKILEICQKTGKFPFIFVNDEILAIEEKGFAWTEARHEDDVYPGRNQKMISNRQLCELR